LQPCCEGEEGAVGARSYRGLAQWGCPSHAEGAKSPTPSRIDHPGWNRTSMTLPNLLTGFRIVLIPVFVLLLVYDARVYALTIFLLSCLSDLLDGYIARTWQQQTTLGAFLDPIADKLLMVTTFITLAVLGGLPLALTIVLVTRDVTLSLIFGIVLFTTGRHLEGPTLLGRGALFCQMATVVLGLIFYVFESHAVFQALRPFILVPVFVATGVLAVVAGLHYLYQVVRLLQKVEQPLDKRMPVQ